MYEQQYDGYMLPYRTQTGSTTRWTWAGSDVLGPTLGLNTDGTNTGNIYVMEKIKKMLSCPSVIHPYIDPTVPSALWDGSYTYNQSMGNCNNAPSNVPPVVAPTYQIDTANPAAGMVFRRKATLPMHQLVMMDVRNNTSKNDLGFANVNNLVNTTVTPNFVDNPDNTSGAGIAGDPHSGKKANMLFTNGEVILGDPLLLANHNWIVEPDATITSGNGAFPFN